jgi:ribonuclease HII
MLKAKFNKENLLEAGCDEAGRGCLAGPVVAAAVILPEKISISELNDSKKLSEKQRNKLRPVIEEKALAWAVGIISPEKIDEINILNASFLAMHEAIKKLSVKPQFLIIDGNRFNPFQGIPHACIVKGDAKFKAIAAASILAKTWRDEIMEKLHDDFPQYGWNENKGYPTVFHRNAIRETGSCIHHRKSFTLLPSQLELF